MKNGQLKSAYNVQIGTENQFLPILIFSLIWPISSHLQSLQLHSILVKCTTKTKIHPKVIENLYSERKTPCPLFLF